MYVFSSLRLLSFNAFFFILLLAPLYLKAEILLPVNEVIRPGQQLDLSHLLPARQYAHHRDLLTSIEISGQSLSSYPSRVEVNLNGRRIVGPVSISGIMQKVKIPVGPISVSSIQTLTLATSFYQQSVYITNIELGIQSHSLGTKGRYQRQEFVEQRLYGQRLSGYQDISVRQVLSTRQIMGKKLLSVEVDARSMSSYTSVQLIIDNRPVGRSVPVPYYGGKISLRPQDFAPNIIHQDIKSIKLRFSGVVEVESIGVILDSAPLINSPYQPGIPANRQRNHNHRSQSHRGPR